MRFKTQEEYEKFMTDRGLQPELFKEKTLTHGHQVGTPDNLKVVRFTVLGDPIHKGRPRVSTKGRFPVIYTDSKTRKGEEEFLQKALPFRPPKPFEGYLKAEITAVYTIPKSFSKSKAEKALAGRIRPTKQDADNVAKAVLDSLNKVFYVNDNLIVKLVVEKIYGETAKTEVVLEEIGNGTD